MMGLAESSAAASASATSPASSRQDAAKHGIQCDARSANPPMQKVSREFESISVHAAHNRNVLETIWIVQRSRFHFTSTLFVLFLFLSILFVLIRFLMVPATSKGAL